VIEQEAGSLAGQKGLFDPGFSCRKTPSLRRYAVARTPRDPLVHSRGGWDTAVPRAQVFPSSTQATGMRPLPPTQFFPIAEGRSRPARSAGRRNKTPPRHHTLTSMPYAHNVSLRNRSISERGINK
jgi:hypothetical protein